MFSTIFAVFSKPGSQIQNTLTHIYIAEIDLIPFLVIDENIKNLAAITTCQFAILLHR